MPARKPAMTPFWTVQLIAWPAYGLISFIGALPYVGLSPHLDSVRSVLVSKAAFTLAGFTTSSLMRILYSRENIRGDSWTRIVPLAITLSYLAALFAAICSNAARQFVSGRHLDSGWSSFFGGAVNASAVFLAWSACYLAIRNYQALEDEKRDALKAKALAHQAQLEMLRSQVSPHFLFNALNSVHALVREDPTRAQIAVEELSDFLRYSLSQSHVVDVPLSEEIGVLEKYLAIEKIRFEEKLLVCFKVQPETEEFTVPGLLLHPLVENAVKYGMQTSPMPLQIELTAKRDGDSLRLAVANSGRWAAPQEETLGKSRIGLGRKLVRQRLAQAYPGRHQFLTRERNGWVENVIVIKLADAGVA
jgi:two-component system LytT family sensor kinase